MGLGPPQTDQKKVKRRVWSREALGVRNAGIPDTTKVKVEGRTRAPERTHSDNAEKDRRG